MSCLRVFNNLARTALGLVLLLLQMVALSAAEPPLTCEASVLPSGQVQYRLSSPVGLDRYPAWEDATDKTVIAQVSDVDPTLVQDRTNQTLVLYKRLDHILFTAQYPVYVETNCSFDNSSVQETPPKNSTVTDPSTKICIGGTCFEQKKFIGFSVALAFLLLVAIAAPWCFYKYKKRRGQSDLAQRAGQLDQGQKMEVVPLRDPPKKDPDALDSTPADVLV